MRLAVLLTIGLALGATVTATTGADNVDLTPVADTFVQAGAEATWDHGLAGQPRPDPPLDRSGRSADRTVLTHRSDDREDRAMQVKEILRVKGNRLISIEPSGRAAEAVATMAKENLGSLVVMDQGRMVGMLTFRELLRALAQRSGSLGEVRVADIMVRDPVTATPDMEVNDLRRTMLDSGARYLPVLQDSRLIGVISFRDVAKAVLEEQDFENKMLKGYIKNWPA